MGGPNWTSWHSLTFKMFRCILNMENSFPNSIFNLWENCPKQMCEIQQETRSAHIEGENASNRTFWSMISPRWHSAKSNKWGDMKGTRSLLSDGKLPVILLRSITVPPLWGVWNFNHPQSRSILFHLFFLFFRGGRGGFVTYLHPMAVMALKKRS